MAQKQGSYLCFERERCDIKEKEGKCQCCHRIKRKKAGVLWISGSADRRSCGGKTENSWTWDAFHIFKQECWYASFVLSHLVGGSVVVIWTKLECSYDDGTLYEVQKALGFLIWVHVFLFQNSPEKRKTKPTETPREK